VSHGDLVVLDEGLHADLVRAHHGGPIGWPEAAKYGYGRFWPKAAIQIRPFWGL
jgi:hypothetical protein